MAFRHPEHNASLPFNSAYSSRLLDIYKAQEESEIRQQCAGAKSRTFAPSGMRCMRKQWFRLRGTETDPIENPDTGLNFRADIGNARHIVIQSRLRVALGADWIEVPDFLREHPIPYKYDVLKSDIESLVQIDSPPIKFAVDGIIRIDGKIFLLEIKTCDYTALSMMQSHKQHHEEQVAFYCAILGLRDVLFIYEERQNGGMKAFQHHVSESDVEAIKMKMSLIMDMANRNIAPDRLSPNDYMCSNCEYAKKCMEW